MSSQADTNVWEYKELKDNSAEKLSSWYNGGVLTEEMRRVLHNFGTVVRVRPQDKDIEANNSDEELEDMMCIVRDEDLANVLQTKIGGRRGKTDKGLVL